jgi:hypothetical protein
MQSEWLGSERLAAGDLPQYKVLQPPPESDAKTALKSEQCPAR